MQIEKRKQLKAITKALTMMPANVQRPSKIKPHHIQYRSKTKSETFAEFAMWSGCDIVEIPLADQENHEIRGIPSFNKVDINLD